MYLGVSAIEIPQDEVNDFAAYWQDEGFVVDAGAVSRADLRVIVRRCMEAYVNAIMVEGIDPLNMSDPVLWYRTNQDLRSYMEQTTGLGAAWCDEFLYNLWGGVKSGKVDPKWLTPATVLDVESQREPSYLDKLGDLLQPASIVEGVTGQFNRTLLIVGAGVLVYFLGKEVLSQTMRR